MGAGDSFLAAFLCSLYTAGWQKAKSMPEQALLAALAAGQQVSARNCMAQGGFGCKAEISRNSIE
jgi:fructoselysine 6-kinase